MRAAGCLAIGMGFYAAALIALAPATVVDGMIDRASGGRLRLANASGSLWAGAGTVEIRSPATTQAIAQRAEWHVLPESLWRGRLVAELRLEGASRPVRVSATSQTMRIPAIELDLPAAALAHAEPRLSPLRLSGNLRMQASGLAVGSGGMQGVLTLQWRGAASSLSPVSPLGSYELRVEGQGEALHASLATLEGPLEMEGSGDWRAGQNPRFRATLHVPPEYREQLTPLLRLMSRQTDEGSFELELQ